MPFPYSNIFQYLLIQKYFSGAVWFMGAVLLTEFIFRKRLWCHWICPQSVLLAIARLFNPFGLKIFFKRENCISDMASSPCQKACSLDIDPRHFNFKSRAQCTNCGDCIDACRKTGKVPGIAAVPQNAKHWIDKGFRFVTVGSELYLLQAKVKEVLATLR